MIRYLLILTITATPGFAVDDKVPGLPASTAVATKAYEAEVAKAKAEYDKRDEAAKRIYAVALKKAQDAEMKADNLEGALAIKKKIEELTPKGDLLGDKMKPIAGKWKRDKGAVYEFKSDGTGTSDLDGAISWTTDKTGTVFVSYADHPNWRDKIEVKSGNEAVLSIVIDPSKTSKLVRIVE